MQCPIAVLLLIQASRHKSSLLALNKEEASSHISLILTWASSWKVIFFGLFRRKWAVKGLGRCWKG